MKMKENGLKKGCIPPSNSPNAVVRFRKPSWDLRENVHVYLTAATPLFLSLIFSYSRKAPFPF